jgi:hypothetical protein
MYNYYTYLKNKDEKLKLDKIKKEEDNLKHERKQKINKLIVGYENRLKNFIYTMGTEPIIIKDSTVNIETTRKKLYDEQADKIRDRHGMILKGFKTEKQRIEEYLEEKNYGFTVDEREKEFIKILNSTDSDKSVHYYKENDPVLVQPSMRFKPRSDLERIYDANNDYNLGRVDKKIIEKHLDAMGLYGSRRVKTEVRESDDYMNTRLKTLEENKQAEAEKIKKRRDVIREKRKENNNYRNNRYRLDPVPVKHIIMDSKNIMGDLHYKTHFKGAADFTISPEKFTNRRKRGSRKPIDDTISNSGLYDSVSDKLPNLSHMVSNLNTNPCIRKENLDNIDKKEFHYLKELAFRKQEPVDNKVKKVSFSEKQEKSKLDPYLPFPLSESFVSEHPLIKRLSDNLDKKPDDDRIVIGSKEFYRDDIGSISKHVLVNCNYFHRKSKINDTSLKVGNGRLSHTRGLSIIEFLNKYNVETTTSSK